MSREKVFHLKAMGVEVRDDALRRGQGPIPTTTRNIAEKIAADTGAFYVKPGSANEANTCAHETTTGPGDLGADGSPALDANRWCGVGSAGHAGRAHALLPQWSRRRWPMVLGGSCRLDPGRRDQDREARAPPGSWLIEGIGEDFIPPIADLSGRGARPTA